MSLPFVSRSAHAALETKMGELNQEYQNFRRRNASVREDAYRQGGSDAIAALLSDKLGWMNAQRIEVSGGMFL